MARGPSRVLTLGARRIAGYCWPARVWLSRGTAVGDRVRLPPRRSRETSRQSPRSWVRQIGPKTPSRCDWMRPIVVKKASNACRCGVPAPGEADARNGARRRHLWPRPAEAVLNETLKFGHVSADSPLSGNPPRVPDLNPQSEYYHAFPHSLDFHSCAHHSSQGSAGIDNRGSSCRNSCGRGMQALVVGRL